MGKAFLLLNLLLPLVVWRCRLRPDSYFVLTGCFVLFTGTGIVLLLLARRSSIAITHGELVVTFITKTIIPFATITNLTLDLIMIGRYASRQHLALFIVAQQNKRIKIHLEFFERYRDLIQSIVSNTSAKLDISDRARKYMQEREIRF